MFLPLATGFGFKSVRPHSCRSRRRVASSMFYETPEASRARGASFARLRGRSETQHEGIQAGDEHGEAVRGVRAGGTEKLTRDRRRPSGRETARRKPEGSSEATACSDKQTPWRRPPNREANEQSRTSDNVLLCAFFAHNGIIRWAGERLDKIDLQFNASSPKGGNSSSENSKPDGHSRSGDSLAIGCVR